MSSVKFSKQYPWTFPELVPIFHPNWHLNICFGFQREISAPETWRSICMVEIFSHRFTCFDWTSYALSKTKIDVFDFDLFWTVKVGMLIQPVDPTAMMGTRVTVLCFLPPLPNQSSRPSVLICPQARMGHRSRRWCYWRVSLPRLMMMLLICSDSSVGSGRPFRAAPCLPSCNQGSQPPP